MPLLSEAPTFPSAALSSVMRLRNHLNTVLRGKAAVMEQVLVCLFARGHLLLEDQPGLGKTTLAKGLAAAIGGRFARVQCTPDLLPSDITGFNVLNQKSLEFEFREGPVFSDVLLTDEINRATPRTQSALLEAMAERQVTIDAVRYPLSPQFFVMATQNPSEQHGTYPLPEAQLDRFAMKLSIGYPHPDDERELLQAAVIGELDHAPMTEPIISQRELAHFQGIVSRIAVAEALQRYIVDVAQATRRHPQVTLGVSPRGALIWQRAAQAQAFLEGREYVVPSDLQRVALPVLGVRLAVEHDRPEPVLREILESIPLPEYR
uniref:MoxR family ATPase n=1 Tax=Schlesneria paludicola TaxID=360056 RepID=A0A7C4QU16_9PLAN